MDRTSPNSVALLEEQCEEETIARNNLHLRPHNLLVLYEALMFDIPAKSLRRKSLTNVM